MMKRSRITIYEFPFALVDPYNTITFCPYASGAFGCFFVVGGLREQHQKSYVPGLSTSFIARFQSILVHGEAHNGFTFAFEIDVRERF